MLIKLWERIRGYDRWVQTDATIESSAMEDHVYDYRGQIKHQQTAHVAFRMTRLSIS